MESFVVMLSQNIEYSGTYMPYRFEKYAETPAPDGFEVAFVNHLGRHGSRFPVSNNDVDSLINLLKQESGRDNLTIDGLSLLSLLNRFDAECEGKWGTLSPLGEYQLKGIGAWIKGYLPYSRDMKVKIWCDPKRRCVQSMTAFLEGMGLDSTRTDEQTLPLFNPLLNFFKTDSSYILYKNGNIWKDIYNEYSESVLKGIDWLGYYIKDVSRYDEANNMDFAMKLFSVVTIAPNMPFDFSSLPSNSSKFMDCLWKTDNAKVYMLKGPSPLCDGISFMVSLPLLRNFIETSEEGVKTGVYGAYLRFAHAETLMPFAALLGIPEASHKTCDVTDICEIWRDYEVSPMAANLIWVFYKNSSGDYILKMLLNGKEVAFPVMTDMFPYYRWDDIRAYYGRLL
jgi:hypothetical protein